MVLRRRAPLAPTCLKASMHRRHILALLASTGLCLTRGARAGHNEPGLLPRPLPLPDLPFTLDDGQRTSLEAIARGKVTALQFVLTSCSATCPVLAAIFQQVQGDVKPDPSGVFQLLSVSLDPWGDTPDSLRQWKARFGAGQGWRAALPARDKPSLTESLQGVDSAKPVEQDAHTAMAFILDRSNTNFGLRRRHFFLTTSYLQDSRPGPARSDLHSTSELTSKAPGRIQV